MNKDLTVGKPSAVLWAYCLPLFGSIVFQQLYNIADSFIAGKFISENALAAVGNSYEITLIFLAFAFGCNIGGSVVVSRLFGGKRYSEMKTAVYTAMLASAALCAVIVAAGLIFDGELLRMIKTPVGIFDDSKLYLDIYIVGLPFTFFYNIATGIFSALGDSKTPFLFLAVSSLTNIGMNILFVSGFGMGVDGLAWATFICQGASCLLALFFIFKRLCGIKTETKPKPFSAKLLGAIAAIAVPSILQQSFISVGNIVIQGVINGFGEAVIAGSSAAIKLNSLVISPLATIGNGVSTYTAQNIGAGKRERVSDGFRASVRIVWMLCIPLSVLYFIFGGSLVSFFITNPTETAVSTGFTFIKTAAPFYFLIAAKLVADGVLRGAGMMKQFMSATFTDLAVRVLLAFFLSQTALGANGIWLAWPVGWVISTTMSVFLYSRGRWR